MSRAIALRSHPLGIVVVLEAATLPAKTTTQTAHLAILLIQCAQILRLLSGEIVIPPPYVPTSFVSTQENVVIITILWSFGSLKTFSST